METFGCTETSVCITRHQQFFCMFLVQSRSLGLEVLVMNERSECDDVLDDTDRKDPLFVGLEDGQKFSNQRRVDLPSSHSIPAHSRSLNKRSSASGTVLF